MIKTDIEKVSDFLSSEGEKIDSHCDDEVSGVALAQELFPGKPYCSVRQWIIAEFDISD